MTRVDAVRGTVSLTGPDARRAGAALGLAARADWAVYFAESMVQPDRLPLRDHGVLLRLRADRRGHEQARIQLRRVRRARLTPFWLALRGTRDHRFRLDLDRSGGGLLAVLDARLPPDSIEAALLGRHPVGSAFTGLQHRLLADCADLPAVLDHLAILGPVRWRRCRPVRWHSYDVSAGWWAVPGGDPMLELGLRVPPGGAEVMWRGFDARLRALGVTPVAGEAAPAILDRLSGRWRDTLDS